MAVRRGRQGRGDGGETGGCHLRKGRPGGEVGWLGRGRRRAQRECVRRRRRGRRALPLVKFGTSLKLPCKITDILYSTSGMLTICTYVASPFVFHDVATDTAAIRVASVHLRIPTSPHLRTPDLPASSANPACNACSPAAPQPSSISCER